MVSISPRPTLVVGWEVRPSISVSQNADRGQVLELIAGYFGCGSIRPDPGDHTIKWETRRLDDIVARVLPHFDRFPMISGKQRDVELLAKICQMMLDKHHLGRQGLLKIVELVAQMNPSGSRRYTTAQIAASAR